VKCDSPRYSLDHQRCPARLECGLYKMFWSTNFCDLMSSRLFTMRTERSGPSAGTAACCGGDDAGERERD